MILGITGGTGCGKTTLLNLIREHGGLVLDCDAIYHELLRTDAVLLQKIESRFPGTVTDGVLDRKKLGSIVFSDAAALTDLNAITHSAIRAEVQRRLMGHSGLAAIDAIALFEGGLASLCQMTVAVTAPREDRILRIMARDGISREYAASRVDAQHGDAWFVQRCDKVLENSGTQESFQRECLAFLRSANIIELSLHRKGEHHHDY